MFETNWLSAVFNYVVESAIELALVFLAVKVVLRVGKLHDPAALGRFLLLPLIIPALLSPILHLVFPQLSHFAIIVQIENAFPALGRVRLYEEFLSPVLIMAFLLILIYNLAWGLAISLREVRHAFGTDLNDKTTLTRLARKFDVAEPSIVVSERHPTCAYVFGWFHPVIALGKDWLLQLDPKEREAVLAHELAHYKRSDNWQMIIARTCCALMFFNPLAHHVYRELSEAREKAADDLALRVTRNPLALASALLKFWQMEASSIASISEGFATRDNDLENRIRRLCDYDDVFPTTNANGLYYSLFVMLTLVLSLV